MGAGVALGVAQSKEMRGIVAGVMAICPIVDWTISVEEKMASVESAKEDSSVVDGKRQRSGSGQQRAEQRTARLHKLIDYSYVPPRHELSDPLLSPAYATRGSMPRQIFMIGAQQDMLCAEAEKMALRLAADERGETVGGEEAWCKGGVQWEKVLDWGHEFAFRKAKSDVRELERQRVLDDLFDRVGDWLWAKVFAYM